MFRLPFGATKEKIIAVADVGGASAAVAIMRMGERGAPSTILASAHSSLPFLKRTKEQSAALVVLALADAARKALAAYGREAVRGPATELYAFAGAPWTETSVFDGRELFDRDRKITDALIASLAKDTLAKGKGEGAEAPIEAHVSEVELNGYPTRAPAGKYARSVRVAVLASGMDGDFRTKAEHALGQAFPALSVTWRSRTRALLAVLRDLPPRIRNCFVVDVSSEEISLMTLRKGAIEARASIPEGTASIMRRISGPALPEEAFVMMRAAENDACSTEECRRVAAAVGETEQWLARLIGEQLSAMATPRRLPNSLYLLAHPDLSPWLARFLARIDFAPFTTTALPFSVVALTPEGIDVVVSSAGSDALLSLSLACALVHTEHNPR